MRILHVLPTYLPAVRYGGPVFAVHALCRALATRGHDVSVVTTTIDGGESVPGRSVCLDGVNVEYFESPFLRRLAYAPQMSAALKKYARSVDLFHLHTVFLWPTWAAARAAGAAGLPYVLSPRGMLVGDLIATRNRLIKSAWIRFFERGNVENADVVHVTSDVELRELLRLGWSLPEVATVANGVDAPEAVDMASVSRDVRALIDARPAVLFLGRLSWKKGLDRLMDAMAIVPGDAQLAIAGPDDEALAPVLTARAAALGIAGRVRILPRVVTGADREFLYRSARVFVLPSLSENFGNTVLEAMLRARPVIVTPEVGAAEIVREAGGGLVVAGEPAPLAAAIGRMVSDPATADAMGRAGEQHVRESHGWPMAAARMEALYAGVLAHRAGRVRQ
jgi:glycosyltransferase involved in cell wall biosynthesis